MKSDAEIRKIVQSMTLEERIALCSGKTFWETKAFPKYGIPSLFMSDGSHGLRKQEREGGADMLGVNESNPATCFPAEVTTSGSWDPELLEKIGHAIAEEAVSQHVGMVLGPGENIKRNPLCGRNFEYFSEDPYLAGKLAAGYIRGMERRGVSTSLKHFAANSQEYMRFSSNSVMDERTLREIYLRGFEIAVKEGKPSTVMCAYPKLNGVHCSDSRKLLTDILRKDRGFDGMVVTDWGAMNDRIKGFQAGCDLNMPGGSAYMENECLAAVKDGRLSEEDINRSAERVLRVVFRAAETLGAATDISGTDAALAANGTAETLVASETVATHAAGEANVTGQSASADREGGISVAPDMTNRHHELARLAAEEGAVLLKNENHILPLAREEHIAVIGYMAKDMHFQGAGSSHIHAALTDEPLPYFSGTCVYAEGYAENGSASKEQIAEAVLAAERSDKAVIFAGLPTSCDSEGFDRSDMKLPEGENKLISAVAAANPDTVVVLFSGSAVELPWNDEVRAILYMGLPGQAGGSAAVRLLYGDVNPSGKLAESWPVRYEDCVSSSWYGKDKDAVYREGIYVGYRYYDKANLAVRYPFGYGLSYTDFVYTDIKRDGMDISFTVENTGERDGAEIAELYIGQTGTGLYRPIRELKHFQRVELRAGEKKTVHFSLEMRDFAIWKDGWIVPEGEYEISVGPSSRELPLTASIKIDANTASHEMRDADRESMSESNCGPHVMSEGMNRSAAGKEAVETCGVRIAREENQTERDGAPADDWYRTCRGIPMLADFERMSGIHYEPVHLSKGSYTMDSTVSEMKKDSLVMKIMYKAVENTVAKGFGGKKDYNNPEFRMLMASSAGSPLRSMQISGGIKGGIMQGLLEMANGHGLKGIVTMIRGK